MLVARLNDKDHERRDHEGINSDLSTHLTSSSAMMMSAFYTRVYLKEENTEEREWQNVFY